MAKNGVNKCIFYGNVGKVEIKGSGDKRVAIVSLAVQTWRDEQPEWVKLVVFGKQVDTVEQYVEKGSTLFVEARFHLDVYEGDNGKRYTAEFHVKELQLMGKPKQQAPADDDEDYEEEPAPAPKRQAPAPASRPAPTRQAPQAQPQAKRVAKAQEIFADDDEDLPF